jgi:hypothetical protein
MREKTMKKHLLIFILLLAIPLLATYTKHDALLDGTLGVLATATATNGPAADFLSKHIGVANAAYIGVTVLFTPAAGSASTVDFVFEVSYDGGGSAGHWATFAGAEIKVATNTPAAEGSIVRVFYEMAVYGASHFRLKSVKNNDAANDITAVNVVVSR